MFWTTCSSMTNRLWFAEATCISWNKNWRRLFSFSQRGCCLLQCCVKVLLARVHFNLSWFRVDPRCRNANAAKWKETRRRQRGLAKLRTKRGQTMIQQQHAEQDANAAQLIDSEMEQKTEETQGDSANRWPWTPALLEDAPLLANLQLYKNHVWQT